MWSRLLAKIQALLGAIDAPDPDRPPPHQIAHHDPIRMPIFARDLVKTDGLGARPPPPPAPELLSHILLLQAPSLSSRATSLTAVSRQRQWHSVSFERTIRLLVISGTS